MIARPEIIKVCVTYIRLARSGLNCWFYGDFRTHNVTKVRVLKYIFVYGQIKAADQKY